MEKNEALTAFISQLKNSKFDLAKLSKAVSDISEKDRALFLLRGAFECIAWFNEGDSKEEDKENLNLPVGEAFIRYVAENLRSSSLGAEEISLCALLLSSSSPIVGGAKSELMNVLKSQAAQITSDPKVAEEFIDNTLELNKDMHDAFLLTSTAKYEVDVNKYVDIFQNLLSDMFGGDIAKYAMLYIALRSSNTTSTITKTYFANAVVDNNEADRVTLDGNLVCTFGSLEELYKHHWVYMAIAAFALTGYMKKYLLQALSAYERERSQDDRAIKVFSSMNEPYTLPFIYPLFMDMSSVKDSEEAKDVKSDKYFPDSDAVDAFVKFAGRLALPVILPNVENGENAIVHAVALGDPADVTINSQRFYRQKTLYHLIQTIIESGSPDYFRALPALLKKMGNTLTEQSGSILNDKGVTNLGLSIGIYMQPLLRQYANANEAESRFLSEIIRDTMSRSRQFAALARTSSTKVNAANIGLKPGESIAIPAPLFSPEVNEALQMTMKEGVRAEANRSGNKSNKRVKFTLFNR